METNSEIKILREKLIKIKNEFDICYDIMLKEMNYYIDDYFFQKFPENKNETREERFKRGELFYEKLYQTEQRNQAILNKEKLSKQCY